MSRPNQCPLEKNMHILHTTSVYTYPPIIQQAPLFPTLASSNPQRICADFWMAVVRASAFPLDRVMFSQWRTASPLIVAADGPGIRITKTSSAVTTASTRMAVVVVDNRSVDGVFADLSFSDCLRMVRGIAKVVGTRRLICQHCFYYGCFYYYCHCDRHCLLMLNPPWIVKIQSFLKAEDFLRLL